jgi:hypothetical protein
MDRTLSVECMDLVKDISKQNIIDSNTTDNIVEELVELNSQRESSSSLFKWAQLFKIT